MCQKIVSVRKFIAQWGSYNELAHFKDMMKWKRVFDLVLTDVITFKCKKKNIKKILHAVKLTFFEHWT